MGFHSCFIPLFHSHCPIVPQLHSPIPIVLLSISFLHPSLLHEMQSGVVSRRATNVENPTPPIKLMTHQQHSRALNRTRRALVGRTLCIRMMCFAMAPVSFGSDSVNLPGSEVATHRRLYETASKVFIVIIVILLVVLFVMIVSIYVHFRRNDNYARLRHRRHRNVGPNEGFSARTLSYLMHLLELD